MQPRIEATAFGYEAAKYFNKDIENDTSGINYEN